MGKLLILIWSIYIYTYAVMYSLIHTTTTVAEMRSWSLDILLAILVTYNYAADKKYESSAWLVIIYKFHELAVGKSLTT